MGTIILTVSAILIALIVIIGVVYKARLRKLSRKTLRKLNSNVLRQKKRNVRKKLNFNNGKISV